MLFSLSGAFGGGMEVITIDKIIYICYYNKTTATAVDSGQPPANLATWR